jgi:hypothetical protein
VSWKIPKAAALAANIIVTRTTPTESTSTANLTRLTFLGQFFRSGVGFLSRRMKRMNNTFDTIALSLGYVDPHHNEWLRRWLVEFRHLIKNRAH